VKFLLGKALTLLLLFFVSHVEAESNVLRMASTTSMENSGLLKHLLPPFEAKCGSGLT
jgi:tungstate transport system substrate-binding protein